MEVIDVDADEEKEPVDDVEVAPADPPPLAEPPWVNASIDTVEHNRAYYMPAERGLGHYMTKKVGGVRIDSLTTRELMGIRVIWHDGIEWTIPPWATHLNA
eukprot:16444013-Heterocapsa_arctica.AAC.1